MRQEQQGNRVTPFRRFTSIRDLKKDIKKSRLREGITKKRLKRCEEIYVADAIGVRMWFNTMADSAQYRRDEMVEILKRKYREVRDGGDI